MRGLISLKEFLPLTLGSTAVTKMWDSKLEPTRYKTKLFVVVVVFQVLARWLLSGASSWFRAETRRGHYLRVVTREAGCRHHAFLTPVLEANTAHKPCCHPAWVAPRSRWRHTLRGRGGGAPETENKNNQAGLSPAKCPRPLFSPCPRWTRKSTGFCRSLSEEQSPSHNMKQNGKA